MAARRGRRAVPRGRPFLPEQEDSDVSMTMPAVLSPARSVGGPQWSPAESAAASVEDDDDRSETSSETNSRDSSGALTPKSNAATPYANHRDLSERLLRAIGGGGGGGGGASSVSGAGSEDGSNAESNSNGNNNNSGGGPASHAPVFDESMIGADVVLCVRAQSSWRSSAQRRLRRRRCAEEDAVGQTDATNSATVASPVTANAVTRFYAHRFMLAASSEPFRAMLTGHMREAAQRDVEIHDVEPAIVEKMLVFIYTGEVTVDLQNVVGLLTASELYELSGLREICKNFVLIHAQDVFRDGEMVQIPEKVLIEIVDHNDLQIREVALMEALVMWGEARVARSDDTPLLEILSDVMECVRFPTMSVSDLYGKVRPLVADAVIRESLLTEALFFHLKWGNHAGAATKRMKPRAGTTALRKRKRVSFTHHVSFVTE